jgi:transcriptional regulator with XRE-family HTH domain
MMDINAIVSANLTAWMSASPDLSTLKQVAAKSKVGFGTVRRAKNGDGNLTVQNMEAVAGAFKRSLIDLLTPSTYPPASAMAPRTTQETDNGASISRLNPADHWSPILRQIIAEAEHLPDEALIELRGQVKLLRQQHTCRAKANPPASSA